MQCKRVGTVGIGNGHHRAVTSSECGHSRRDTILTVGAVGAGRALRTVMDGESVGTVSVGNSHHRAKRGRSSRYNGRETVLTIGAVRTIGTVRTVGTVMHSESGSGSIGIVDGIGIVQTTGDRTGDAGDTASVGTSCARSTGGTGRTCGAGSTGGTIMHHKIGRSSIGKVDGVSVVQTAGHRTCDGQNATTVLAVLAVRAVSTIQDGERMRTVSVCDGHLCAGGRGSGGHDW